MDFLLKLLPILPLYVIHNNQLTGHLPVRIQSFYRSKGLLFASTGIDEVNLNLRYNKVYFTKFLALFQSKRLDKAEAKRLEEAMKLIEDDAIEL